LPPPAFPIRKGMFAKLGVHHRSKEKIKKLKIHKIPFAFPSLQNCP
jgi:hypothetical protein